LRWEGLDVQFERLAQAAVQHVCVPLQRERRRVMPLEAGMVASAILLRRALPLPAALLRDGLQRGAIKA
jgi:hypothetical protein